MVWPLPELPIRWEALPCTLDAGWALIRLWELPKRADNGLSLGGFSAAAYQASDDRLWLVSDASRGYLLPVGPLAKALRTGDRLQVGPRLVLRDQSGTPLPPSFDAEGLVLTGNHGVWIVSEGRRQAGHQAR
ncbi:MAG: esterase-like activity of phytase family protein, partial [Synechococcus sp. cluster2_bin.235]|nr:esterase-like activity of phytase family protein [Synechococcus sp. cluster2_bin.235]